MLDERGSKNSKKIWTSHVSHRPVKTPAPALG
jgi:hypothetical protein